MKHWRMLAMLALFSALALLGACDSDDGTTPGETDTTAPLVTLVSPAQNETDASVDETIVVSFSEDMDPDSATGNITLSSGTLGALSWSDAQTLNIAHTDWSDGTEITVTVGTGLADEAGNTLAEAFTWSFWTYTNEVLLLNTMPEDGDVDVVVNTQIWLQFSESMNGSTLPGAVTISSPDKASIAYTLSGGDDAWILTPDADMPSDTEITVTVGTGAENNYGTNLATEASFSFTTGSTADTTPPNLISIEPANGSTIPTDTQYLRLTFDEPMADDCLGSPSLVSGQLMLAMDDPDEAGVWTENNTVFTIGLNPPLVPGAVFAVSFDSYADLSGNVQTTPFEWEVVVAGDADYYPVTDDMILYYEGTWSDGSKESDGAYMFNRYDVRTGGEFWLWDGDYDGGTFVWEDYDRYKLTSSAVQYLGFYEVEDDKWDATKDLDITFDPVIDWLKLPVGDVSSWSGSADFTPAPADGHPDNVTYTITVAAGTVDLEVPNDLKENDGAPMFWMDCRRVDLEYHLFDGTTELMSSTDTYWYAPGVGPVRQLTEETEGSSTYTEDLYLIFMGTEDDLLEEDS